MSDHHDSPLDEALSFNLLGTPLSGELPAPREDSIPPRPNRAGWNVVAASTGQRRPGLAFLATPGKLELLELRQEAPEVVASIPVESNVVFLACSPDARLVAAACEDGSLRCYDVTQSGLSHRWTLQNVHSHPEGNPSRKNAAAAAGPVRSLAFAADSNLLLLVDSNRGSIRIYDAAADSPADLVQNQLNGLQVSSADWKPSGKKLALGTTDGFVLVLSVDMENGGLEMLSTMNYPGDDGDRWVCTHLHWFENECLAAGYCRVTPAEEEDDDEEDDSAEHEACLFIARLTEEDSAFQESTELGDVVPFFSIPRHGRHVFYTAYVSTSLNDISLLLVVSNVASDVGVVSQQDGLWQVIDLQEGCMATTPTDEDDEFMYPVGLASAVMDAGDSSGRSVLLLPSTDGQLSVFAMEHRDHDDFAQVANIGSAGLESLPIEAVETHLAAAQTTAVPVTSPSSPSIPDASPALAFGSGVTGDLSFGATSTPVGFGVKPSSSGFTFGSTGRSTFGAAPAEKEEVKTPEDKSVFGAASGLSFGVTDASAPGGTKEEPKTSKSLFGATAFGSGASAPTFGSPSGGGFAAMAKNPIATSFSPQPASGFSFGEKSSPFGAFTTATETSTPGVPSSMVKPLFGTPAKEPEPAKEVKPVEAPASVVAKPSAPVASSPKEETEAIPIPATAAATEAARVFDTHDTKKTGSLPSSKLEDLLDDLGEGFYGDEFQKQLVLLDPENTGSIDRSTFASWYSELLDEAKGGEEGEEELDEEEEAERREETEKATKAFAAIAKGAESINPSEFGKLMEAMGTTYCEEEHLSTIKKLTQDGKISRYDFLSWYVRWLFGEEDESEEEEDEEEEAEEYAPPQRKDGNGWGTRFKVDEGSWKCEVCMVQNQASATVCVSCETSRPGHEGGEKKAEKSSSVPGSIGSGGFVFQAPTPSDKGSTSVSLPGEKPTTIFGASLGRTPTAAASSGYPPISSKVPTPFGGASTTASSTIGSSGFTFGTPKTGEVKESASADKSIIEGEPAEGGSKNSFTVQTTPSASSYPPLSSKAPAPFSSSTVSAATKTESKAKSISASSYPPVSTKAPTPFGVKESKPASVPAYPPLSTKAPTPFSAEKEKPKPAPAPSGAYPPMAAKAPTPFGVKEAKPASGSAYPPLTTKAPTPFSAQKEKPKAARAPSSSYPPMAAVAPTPFATSVKPTASKAPSTSSFPMMPSREPTSFGVPSADHDTKGITGASGLVFGTSTLDKSEATHPTPFTAKTTAAPADAEVKSAFSGLSFGTPAREPEQKKTSASGAYPPLATKAPTPFGTGASSASWASKAGAPSSSSTGVGLSGYPASSARQPRVTPKAPTARSTGDSARPALPPDHLGTRSEKTFKTTSEYETRMWDAVNSLDKAVRSLSEESGDVLDRKTSGDAHDKNFERSIERLTTHLEDIRDSCAFLDSKNNAQGQLAVFLLSRESDIQRQVTEAQRLIDENTGSQPGEVSHGDVVQGQPLDAESEKRRRGLTSKAISVQKRTLIVQERLQLLKGLIESLPSKGTSSSKTSSSQVEGGVIHQGTKVLLRAIKNDYDRAREFESSVRKVNERMDAVRSCVPSEARMAGRNDLHGRSPSTQTAKPSTGRKARLEPLPFKAETATLRSSQEYGDARTSSRLLKVRQAVNVLGSGAVPIRTVSRRGHVAELSGRWKDSGSGGRSDWRTRGRSELMSPTRPAAYALVRTGRSSSVTKPLFGSPEVSARSGWSVPSNVDTSKAEGLSIDSSQLLTEISASAASREALAAYGTTPERAANAINAIRRQRESGQQLNTTSGALFSSGRSAAEKKMTTPLKEPSSGSTNASPVKMSAAAAFPPMPTKSPTPFSRKRDEGTGVSKTESRRSSTFSGAKGPAGDDYGILGSKKEMPFGKKERDAYEPGSSDKVETSTFGGMQSLGDALSLGASKEKAVGTREGEAASRDNKGLTPTTPILGPGSVTVQPEAEPDYHAILTSIYQKYSPSRLADVGRTLEKYKGREREMFGKIARKYGIPDPLQKSEAKSAQMMAFGSGDSTTVRNDTLRTSTTPILGTGSDTIQPEAEPDYHIILTSFYQKHNPSRLADVDQTLAKYKGREREMFGKLARKYGVPDPLQESSAKPAQKMAFGSGDSTKAKTPFASPPGATMTQKTTTQSFSAAPSPFSTSSPQLQPQPSTSTFGMSMAPSPSQFSNPFGAAAPSPSPFSQSASSNTMAADGATGSATPFGQPPASQPGASLGTPSIGGRNPRDILVAFYQKYNPSKVAEVHYLLTKYKGKEEQMFRNLAKKYSLDPSLFGLSSAPTSPLPTGFGSPPAATPAGGGFGQPSALGAGGFGAGTAAAPSPFGAPSGFGQASSLGGGAHPGAFAPSPGGSGAFGSSPQASAPASFGALASGSPASGLGGGFGSMPSPAPAGTSPFGAPAASGFGAGFGGSAGSFGSTSASPFGGPRR